MFEKVRRNTHLPRIDSVCPQGTVGIPLECGEGVGASRQETSRSLARKNSRLELKRLELKTNRVWDIKVIN